LTQRSPGKRLEVRIRGVKLRLMLDGQRRQMRVGGEIAGRPEGLEQPEEDLGVPVSRIDNAHVWLREPGARERKLRAPARDC
jgi:hypothetical protein